ncbi:MAG TPA: hypothetical protein VNR00_03290 [Opitutus sp.]|nr:hypothetical protein [Opitutus sp.]
MNAPLSFGLKNRLAAEGPIRVGVVGAGAAARMALRHLLRCSTVRVLGIANRTPQRVVEILAGAGRPFAMVRSAPELDGAASRGAIAVAADPAVLCESPAIEAIVEATGSVEFGAAVTLSALLNRKHVVLLNAELDATLGPLLKRYADDAGVVFTHTDGEEPAVALRLVQYLRDLGLHPVAAGNLKGMLDRRRNPDTQRAFAAAHGLDPAKAASFADGTKLALEAALLANATGFRAGVRGMHGPRCAHIREIATLLPAGEMLAGGLVDYALSTEPSSGAFAIVHEPDPDISADLAYFKMGAGPFHVFCTPYHLPPLQIVAAIHAAVLRHEPTVAPVGPPVCEVAALAKRPLRAGEVLDGVGGYCCYGAVENADTFAQERLLPIGISGGCRLLRDVAVDEVVRYDDVECPPNRRCDLLRDEQHRLFAPAFAGV